MASKPIGSARPGAGAIAAAALLPPLGVHLARGMGTSFWIAASLTCLGVVPGSIYALFKLFNPGRGRASIA